MSRRCLFAAAAGLALGTLCVARTCGGGGTPGGDQLARRAVGIMRADSTECLDILAVPWEILTVHALSPEELERQYYYKMSARYFQRSALQEDLISALEGSEITPDLSARGDQRWACIFYDTKGARVLTIYFDSFGREGWIAGTPVRANGEFVEVLEKRCSPFWKRAGD